ncbi:jerky protein homolog [Perognathus longimembris pacificus]|uniref:jerky protein homolog n=1 Tax=Perognathus longimembris pacificus TaxID=214514 RepID=UPI002019A463|nr:jerky protein homolog [Perognathus longimembris pacificus]
MAAQRAPGKGPGEKRKRVVLTLREKIDICTRLERGESRKALMQEYNVGMSTLYDIKAHKAQLLRFFANSDSHQALERRRTLHTPKLEHLDRVLYEWFLVKRAEGTPVSGPMLIEKAKDLYEQMQLAEPCVFSGGWLWRFKARHGIKKLDASGEKQATDRRAAEQFCGFFRSLAAEHGLSPEQVYNANETGLFWRRLPGPGPDGGTVPGPRQGKDRLTLLLCANATGSHRIEPLAVGRGGGPRAARGVQHLPGAYRAQGNAWVDKEIFSDWFHHVFAPAVRERFRTVGLPAGSKALLLLDASRAHPPAAELASEDIVTVFLPAGAASALQPMEQGIRRDFMRRLVSPPAALHGLHGRHGASDAVWSVACAWEAVPSQVFRRAWRKLWPAELSPAPGGSGAAAAAEGQPAGPPGKALAHLLELVAAGPCGPGGGARERGGGREAPAARAGGGDEAAWERAAASFEAVVGFAERQPCFSMQEAGQLRALHAVFRRQRQLRRRLGAPGAAVKLEAPPEGPGGRPAAAPAPAPRPPAAGEG